MTQYCGKFLDNYHKRHFKKKGRRASQINSNIVGQDSKRSIYIYLYIEGNTYYRKQ